MIRFTFAAAFFLFVIVMLEIPSIYPAARFMEQIRVEHAICSHFWNEQHAFSILERMLDLDEATSQGNPALILKNTSPNKNVGTVAETQGSLVSARFIRNPYFRAIGAMFTLVAYRLSGLFEWQPIILTMCIVIALDGFAVRIIKSKVFIQHNPQLYALYTSLMIVTVCGAGIAFMLPFDLAPLFAPTLQVASAIFLNRAVSNYQRRG